MKLSYNKKVDIGKPVKDLNTKEGDIHIHEEEKPLSELPEVKELIEKAKEEAYKKGYDKGKSEGIEEGLKKKEEEYASVADSLNAIVDEIRKKLSDILREAEPKILSLLKEAVEIVVEREVALSGSNLPAIISEIIKEIPLNVKIKIRLNEEDLRGIKDKIKIREDIKNQIEFVADKSIDKGGCFIETGIENIDSTIKTRIDKVKEVFDTD